MEVDAIIPQVAWNGHVKHDTKDVIHYPDNHIVTHSTLIDSIDHVDCNNSDNSDSNVPPPLPSTPPPDYFSGTEETRSSSSGLQSGQESYNESGEYFVPPPSGDTQHINPSSEIVTHTTGDDEEQYPTGSERLTVLEQLKSDSTSKLIQLQMAPLKDSPDEEDGKDRKSMKRQESDDKLEIARLKKEVASLQEQNKQLLNLRSQMDGEIENLTSSLFEEAYKMVNEAKAGKILAEKKLADAKGKIDAMEAEVVALRVLLEHNGTPTLPPSVVAGGSKKAMNRKISGLKHQRSNSVDRGLENKPSTSSSSQGVTLLHMTEVEEQELQEFTSWLEGMSTDSSDPFIQHIMDIDVIPCLSFTNQMLSQSLVTAVQQNSLQMELISNTSDCTSECALTGAKDKPCQYRMRLKDSDSWHYISLSSRNKIATVCNFFMFLRHIQQGLVKTTTKTIYTELCKLRASMHMARLGIELKAANN